MGGPESLTLSKHGSYIHIRCTYILYISKEMKKGKIEEIGEITRTKTRFLGVFMKYSKEAISVSCTQVTFRRQKL